ncbi:MAG: phosphate signaling complex protein PhoU [Ruminiclostridium sp.]|nr:phosphate signaling complex protein PhoU [Ruminiclostridium sp.]
MRNRYNAQLKNMYTLMTAMGGLCQDAIGVSVKTLEGEEEAARQLENHVFAVDHEIDDMEREIESLCTKLLLQQQPVATDLRRITAALKMITDLERIGDQAADIAELAHFIRPYQTEAKAHLEQMADEAIRMVRESVEAFVRLDLDLARQVIAYDDVVDGWFHRIKDDLIAMLSADSRKGEEALDILMVAKYLERIGDHATNLAEWVEYAVTGQRSKDGAPYIPGVEKTGM